MDTHTFSLRLGFGHTLTATWLMSLGLEPAITTETEYLWHEGQLDAARRAITARMGQKVSEGVKR